MRRLLASVVFLLAVSLLGCSTGADGYPVAGTVEWTGGDLTGHLVEASLVSDPTVRGFGTIGSGGRFTLERLVDGKPARGLLAGDYQARLILNDEGDGQTKRPKIPARYLDAKTAGWKLKVPTTGDVTLSVSAK